jgi:hypothetical protein
MGIRAGPPYPGLKHLKEIYDFDVAGWLVGFEGCQSMKVDIQDSTLDRLTEIVLSELSLKTARDIRPRSLDASAAEDVSTCTVSDNLTNPPSGKLIYLAKDRHASDFYNGTVRSIDLLGEPAAGVYNFDPYLDGHLKWTNGNAQWRVPYNKISRSLSVSMWQQVAPLDMTIQIFINGEEIYKGSRWTGRRVFLLDARGPLTIDIVSPSFDSPGDPRRLGVPLANLILSR